MPAIYVPFRQNYNSLTVDYLLKKIKQDEKLVVVNAGTPGAIGFTKDVRKEFAHQFVDVGIAEEHAVAMSSALAKGGCKPVFWVLSSFVQRTYDQLSHDLALNKNPAVILVSWAGIGSNDATHLGTFDIPMISNIPNLVCLAPAFKEECFAMLDWALEQTEHPVVIRVPSHVVSCENNLICKDFLHSKLMQEGSLVALLGVGSFFGLAQKVYDALKEKGINATLINPACVSQLDETLLQQLQENHSLVVTMEDGILSGGYGQKVASFYGSSDMKVLNYGADKEFTDRVPLDVLYQKYRLTVPQILEDILKVVG